MTLTPEPTGPISLARSDPRAAWRVAVSILSVFALAGFLLAFFVFWAGSFTVLQSLAVGILSILVFTAINGAVWASWSVRSGRTQIDGMG